MAGCILCNSIIKYVSMLSQAANSSYTFNQIALLVGNGLHMNVDRPEALVMGDASSTEQVFDLLSLEKTGELNLVDYT